MIHITLPTSKHLPVQPRLTMDEQANAFPLAKFSTSSHQRLTVQNSCLEGFFPAHFRLAGGSVISIHDTSKIGHFTPTYNFDYERQI